MSYKVTPLCVFCKNLDWSEGSLGYSSWTPGWTSSMSCNKYKPQWKTYDHELATLKEYRDLIRSAETCDEFVADDGET